MIKKLVFPTLLLFTLLAHGQSPSLPFAGSGAQISITAPNGSSSVSTTLPGAQYSGGSIQVFNSGTVSITFASSTTVGGAISGTFSTTVGAGTTGYYSIPLATTDVAVYGIAGTATVYLQRGNGGGGSGGGGTSGVSQIIGSNNILVSPSIGTGAVTLFGKQTIDAQTGTTYAIPSTDAGALVTRANAGSCADTLPVATTTGYTAGFSFDYQNKGSATCVITPTTSTINGNATLSVAANAGCTVTSDGANYQISACTAASSGGGGAVNATTLTTTPTNSVTDAGNVGYTALQTGVPFILANTCTISTLGALSGCTALPSVYNGNTAASALMYFPSGTVNVTAATVGFAAGFYWVQMSSTTAGQVCTEQATTTNPAYVSGSPVAPLTCTAPANAVNAVFSTGIATINGPTVTIAANAMGPNGSLEFDEMLTNEVTSTASHTLKNTFAALAVGGAAQPTTAPNAALNVRVRNTGYAQSQSTSTIGPVSATSATLQNTVSAAHTGINTTVAKVAAVTMTLSTATASNMVLENCSIRVYPN